MVVYLATAHGDNTPGKRSPKDAEGGTFREYRWSRKICFMLKYLLKEYYKYNSDFDCVIDVMGNYEMTENDTQKSGVSKRIALNKTLQQKSNPTKDKNFGCIMVTIHVNAAPVKYAKNAPESEKWVKNPNSSGWGMWLHGQSEEYVDKSGNKKKRFKEHSNTRPIDRELCSFFYYAKDIVNGTTSYDLNGGCGKKTTRKYNLGAYGILRQSLCPAAMSENFIQNNREEVKFLRSIEGEEAVLKIHLNAIIAFLKKYGYERKTNESKWKVSSVDMTYPPLYSQQKSLETQLLASPDFYLNCAIIFDFTNKTDDEIYKMWYAEYANIKTSPFLYKIIRPKGEESELLKYIDSASPKEIVFETFPILSDSELNQIIKNSAKDAQSNYWPKI